MSNFPEQGYNLDITNVTNLAYAGRNYIYDALSIWIIPVLIAAHYCKEQ